MIGLGTLANGAAVIIGGFAGLLIKGGLAERFKETIMQALGLSVIFLGIAGAMEGMLRVVDGTLITEGTMMMIASIVLGAVVGEWLNLEHRLEQFGFWLRKKVKSEGDNQFIEGFVTSSLTICVGAMAIVGALEDGLTGDASMLIAKAILDGVIILVYTTIFGKGCIFSVIPVVVLQGTITIFAHFLAPIMTDAMIGNLSFIGSMLICCVGVNLMFQTKIKVANMLPALLVTLMWQVFVR